jgi:hypothetical protein
MYIVSFTSRLLHPQRKNSQYPLEDSRVGLDDVKKRKSYPFQDSNPDPSTVHHITSSFTGHTNRLNIV